MIIAELNGGLGNQLFQYANARSQSLSRGTNFLLDISPFECQRIHNGFELNQIFSGKFPICDSVDIKQLFKIPLNLKLQQLLSRTSLKKFQKVYIREPHFEYWPGISKIPDQCYISGYWQSEKYFLNYEKQIRQDLIFPPFKDEMNLYIEGKIRSSSCSVSVHIRRGDYASNPKANSYHGLCPPKYYQDAFSTFSDKGLKIDPFVFSDDIDWVRANIQFDGLSPVFVDHNKGNQSYKDMALMSFCHHHIVANSSFSWWGAWLNPSNNKIVIAPKKWFDKDLNTADLIPNSWTCL
jgi:hypothetical protein